MPTYEANSSGARLNCFERLRFEDPIAYTNALARRIDSKYTLKTVYDEMANLIEADSIGKRVRVKNTTGGALTIGQLIYLATNKLTDQTTGTATSNPSAGENVVILISQTFEVGQVVKISSSGYTEYAYVTAVVAATSVTVDILSYSHTAPVITALPAYKLSLADADGNLPASWITTSALDNNQYGWAYDTKEIIGVDTNSFTLGDVLYLSTTSGAFTNVAPSGANQLVQEIGVVTYVGGAGSGKINAFPGLHKIIRMSSDMMPTNSATFSCRNETTATIPANSLVYRCGYSYTHSAYLIALADADDPTKLAEGIVTSEILNNANGTVYLETTVNSLDTSAYSAVGDPVYLSGTAGGFTNAINNIAQIVGRVRIINATTGSIVFSMDKNDGSNSILRGRNVMDGIRTRSESAPDEFSAASGSGKTTYFRGQKGFATGDNNGGSTVFKPGAKTNSGVDGYFGVEDPSGTDQLKLKVSSTESVVESTKIAKIKGVGSVKLTADTVDQVEVTDDSVLLNAIASGAGTYPLKWNDSTKEVTYDTSDGRIKFYQQELPASVLLSIVKRLNPKQFSQAKVRMKNGQFVIDKENMVQKVGFISQDVEKIVGQSLVLDGIVHKPEDGLWNYDDRAMLAILWGAVQELSNRLTE